MLLHRAHREAVFGESVGSLRECVVVGGGQKFVEDVAVVIGAVVVRKQCPVGGQRVGESGAGVGDDGQAVEARFHREHTQSFELRRHEQIVERLHVAGESEYWGHKLRVEGFS